MHSQILSDWSGGLNLSADDFQLARNETADCLDVDPSPLGGIERRSSFRSLGDSGLSTTDAPRFLYHFQSDSDDNGFILMGNTDGTHDYLTTWATGDITDGHARTQKRQFTTDSTLSNTWSAALVRPRVSVDHEVVLYIHRDRQAKVQTFQTDGLLHSEQTNSYGNYNEDFDNPLGGTCPYASLCCTHLDYLFHADTYENSIRRSSRIRWSHPAQPGDYRENDFVDVGDGHDNDVIRGLVSWANALFIFKERSVWVMTGYDVDTFAMTRLADNIGVSNKNCCIQTVNGVFFFDEWLGLQQIVQKGSAFGIKPMWLSLNTAIDDGRLTLTKFATIGESGGKIYVSGMRWRGATNHNRTFVYDYMNDNGWWAYSVGFRLLRGFTSALGEKHIMGAGPFTNEGGASTNYANYLCIQGYLSSDVDDRFNASTEVTYTGHMTTAWVDGGDAGLKKRFRRFSMVFDNMAATSPFTVLSYRNWSNTTPTARSYTVAGTATPSAADFGMQISKRGGAIGSGYSAALKITGPNDKAWGLNSVTFRFIPQRVI